MKLLRALLFPFSIIYDLITSIRNFLFDKGIFKSTTFNIPIIAVGNLSVGGTGKTPQIEYLIRLLKDDYKVAVLSRGYKRKTKDFVLLDTHHITDDVGDEPMQYFKKFPDINIAVDANRVNGIEQLLKSKDKPGIVLLDDAYQHRKVKAGFYILLTKFDELFSDDFLLPTGNLRESRRGAKRAHIILVTKSPENLSMEEQQKIIEKIRPTNQQQVFFTSISYSEILKGNISIPVSELKNYEVVLVTGIANPSSLLNFLQKKNIRYKHLKFPDHHDFSQKNIDKIRLEYESIKSNKKLLLTTEKDYVRLFYKIEDLSYIEIETQFLNDQSQYFEKEIYQFIKEKITV